MSSKYLKADLKNETTVINFLCKLTIGSGLGRKIEKEKLTICRNLISPIVVD